MTLAPLITAADLTVRGIDTSDAGTTAADIASASDAIRDAAGCAITRQTSTVTFTAEASRRIELPARPVVSVDQVLLDGVLVTDWTLVGGSLWREDGWGTPGNVPSALTVTFTYGWSDLPADIVDLACSLVAGAQRERADGAHRGIAYERVDDYQVGFVQTDERVTAFELPDRTRAMLRRRFGATSTTAATVR